MPALIYGALAWAMGGLLQTVLLGAGLTLVTYIGLTPLVEAALNAAVNNLSQAPADVLQFALLCGVGEALTLLGSAILTRVAISAAVGAVGLKKSGGTV